MAIKAPKIVKKCPYCGSMFEGYMHSVTCGEPECVLENRRNAKKLWHIRQQMLRESYDPDRLIKDVKESRLMHLSYGNYKEKHSPEAKERWKQFDRYVKERIMEYEAARTENRPAASSY